MLSSSSHQEQLTLLRYPEDEERLRQVSSPVMFTPDSLSKMQRMLDMLPGLRAYGLAAIQVGEPRRYFVYQMRPDLEQHIVVNPVLRKAEGEQALMAEGCLSLPGARGMVRRYREIEVAYFEYGGRGRGQLVEAMLHDQEARVFQHEMDHLDGVLFIDRMGAMARNLTLQKYRRLLDPGKE